MSLLAQTMTARELEDRLAQELRAAGGDNSPMKVMYGGCLDGDLHPWRVSTGEQFIVRRTLTESEQAALAMGLDKRLNAMPGKRHEVVSEDYFARESFDFVFDRGHAEAFAARMRQKWGAAPAPAAAPEPEAGPDEVIPGKLFQAGPLEAAVKALRGARVSEEAIAFILREHKPGSGRGGKASWSDVGRALLGHNRQDRKTYEDHAQKLYRRAPKIVVT
mgnify:CR=1 FL=1